MTDQYSGVVLSQDAIITSAIDWRGIYRSQTIYQTFYLPSNYRVGSTSVEQRYPDISGFQVMVMIDAGAGATAALDATLDRYIIGEGWTNLATGVVIGSPIDRQTWFDVIFAQPVTITAAIAGSPLRIGVTTRATTGQPVNQQVTQLGSNSYLVGSTGITAQLYEGVPYPVTVVGQQGFLLLSGGVVTYSPQQGVAGLYYVSPNPLGSRGQAYQSDGKTPLLGTGTTASINFRLLGLTADAGTDFLGNEYRSCVVRDTGDDTDTTSATWMSPPQPSKFAVVSRYYDVRPSPSVPPFGIVNLLLNPSFEYDANESQPFGWQSNDTPSGGGTAAITTYESANLIVGGTWVDQGDNGHPWTSFGDHWESGSPIGSFSNTIQITGLGFNIPANATILGVAVTLNTKTKQGSVNDHSIKLVKAGVATGTNHAAGASWANAHSVGGATDLWGTTLTPADVNDTLGFGVALNATLVGNPFGIAQFYGATVTVYYSTGVVDSFLQVQNGWASQGFQSLRHTVIFSGTTNTQALLLAPGPGTSGFIASPNQIYSARCDVNVLSQPSGGTPLSLELYWYNAAGTFLGTSVGSGTSALGITTLSINGAAAPGGTAYGALALVASGTLSGELDFFVDAALVTAAPTAPPYGDGDSLNWEWLGARGRAISAQLLPVEPQDDTTVIDGVLLDPATPNIAFNVYYSVDDSGQGTAMVERDWEQKLWVRVPRVFTATQSQQYVLPEPIKAKYIKIEFTNLQAQSYDPGPFQQPVTYKKFPTWVANFFIAQLESPSFVANRVDVQNDALTFAYAYYLDDLHESPSQPISAPSSQLSKLSSFFSRSDAQGLVDAATLAQINLTMQQFQLPAGSILSSSTMVGQYAVQTLTAQNRPGTVENPLIWPINYAAVSSLIREPVIFDQSLPVMFFFLTCRHTYKQLAATFDQNVAYFAGVNSISFLRHNYETATDTALYVESGGDTFNAELNDFVVDTDHSWYVY